MIQKLAKEWGEARGFRAALEQNVLGGAGRVDVVLERDDVRVAVEVAVANAPAEIVETVVKDVAAGFAHVIVVSADSDLLRRAETRSAEALPAKDRDKARFLSPDGLRTFLDGLGPGAQRSETTAGYRVLVDGNVTADAGGCRTLARLVGSALLRRRRSS
jgi:hypothetical protein